MSRQAKIIIFSLLLIYSVYNNRNNSSLFDWKEIKEKILEKSNDQKSPIIPPHLKENKNRLRIIIGGVVVIPLFLFISILFGGFVNSISSTDTSPESRETLEFFFQVFTFPLRRNL